MSSKKPMNRKKRAGILLLAGGVGASALLGGGYAAFTASTVTSAQEISSGTTSLVFSNGVGTQAFDTKVSNIAAGDSVEQFFDLTNKGTDELVRYTIAGDFDGNAVTGAGARLASSPEMIDSNGMTVTIVEVNADKTVKDGAVPFTKKINAGSFAPVSFTAGGPTAANAVKHYKVTTTLDTTETAQKKSFVGEYTFAADQDSDTVSAS